MTLARSILPVRSMPDATATVPAVPSPQAAVSPPHTSQHRSSPQDSSAITLNRCYDRSFTGKFSSLRCTHRPAHGYFPL